MADDWTEPGAFEVAPGVHRIPLPLPNDGLRAVNVYAVRAGDGFVLVDAGWAIPEAKELLASALGTLGAGLGDIGRFLITHVHRDHYTQAIAVRQELGTRVSLGIGEKATLDILQEPDRAPLRHQVGHLRMLGASALADDIEKWGSEAPGHTIWESPDDWLSDGELTLDGGRVLDVVETPGHTRGHVVFHDTAAGLLFAGDHVLPTITPSIGFEPAVSPDPLGAFLRSLERVRSRPDAVLLPAHGPVAPSVHVRVDELIAHHSRRLDQAAAAAADGRSAFEAAGILTWTRHERTLDELDPFNQMLAVSETGAHLDLLVAQGRLVRKDIDGVRRYS